MDAWHEQDAFWVKWAPVLFDERRWEQTQEEVTNIVSLLGISPGSSILDLGCGLGRHSLELARRGYRLHAILRLNELLDSLRESARITPDQHAQVLRYLKPET